MGILYILDNDPRFFERRKTKVGIVKSGNSVRKRSEAISKSGQKNRILFTVWLFNERAVEARLHRRYRTRRAKATGSGRTEWFKINWLERQFLKIELLALSAFQQLIAIASACAVGYFISKIIY